MAQFQTFSVFNHLLHNSAVLMLSFGT